MVASSFFRNFGTQNRKHMRKTTFIIMAATLLAIACGKKQEAAQNTEEAIAPDEVSNDRMVYGLACDGCTDTILVLLRDIDADPDTFDILDASRNQQVYGHPRIGDQMALLLAPADTTQTASSTIRQATMVIDIDKLLGSWCYMVTPRLRKLAGVDKSMEQDFLKNAPDSVRRRLLQPREFGFQLKAEYQAQPIGIIRQGNTTDDRSPVEYPELKRYREWRLYNGRLILNEMRRDSLGEQQLLSSDTAEFVRLRRDSLVLRFSDGEHSYYRKEEVEP